MRHIHEDPELATAVDLYVRPGRRYLKLLHGNFLSLPGDERKAFVESLTAAACRATTQELTLLLEGEWRARLTAAVLAGLTQRAVLRDRIGTLLLDSELTYSGQGYCFALASFGTSQDAGLLSEYLDRYLPQTQLRYDQPWALGALLHIDQKLGAHHAARFMTVDGPWQRWAEATQGPVVDPRDYQHRIDTMCELVVGSGEVGS